MGARLVNRGPCVKDCAMRASTRGGSLIPAFVVDDIGFLGTFGSSPLALSFTSFRLEGVGLSRRFFYAVR